MFDVDFFVVGVLGFVVVEDLGEGFVLVVGVVCVVDVLVVKSFCVGGFWGFFGVVEVVEDMYGFGFFVEGDVLDVGIGGCEEWEGDVGGWFDGEVYGFRDFVVSCEGKY